MPKHTTVNPERVQELEDKGGLRPDTLKKRAKALEDLDRFLKENHQISLDDALTNPGFELFLMQYFESLRLLTLNIQNPAHGDPQNDPKITPKQPLTSP